MLPQLDFDRRYPKDAVERDLSIITWIIFGAIAGWVAGKLIGEDRPEGCVTNIVVGIGGALLGGAIYTLITGRDFTAGFNLPSLIIAILGSLLLIFVMRKLFGAER